MHDKRIGEILELAREEGRPLALSPETICALEDNGWLADPFTAQLWPDWSQEQTAPPAERDARGRFVAGNQINGLHRDMEF